MLGLNLYEFINFVILLGMYEWRTNLQMLDKSPKESLIATIENIKRRSNINPAPTPIVSPTHSRNSPKRPNFKEREKNIKRADKNYASQEEASVSLWEKLKLEHENAQKIAKKKSKAKKSL